MRRPVKPEDIGSKPILPAIFFGDPYSIFRGCFAMEEKISVEIGEAKILSLIQNYLSLKFGKPVKVALAGHETLGDVDIEVTFVESTSSTYFRD